MRVWGITGTNGKTTTAWVLAEFLRAASITTVEVNTLARKFSTGYTTPPRETLKEIFREMEDAGARDCVMEVSSHAIHQNRVGFGETTIFAGGAFTNLSEDHLDYHHSMDEYFRVKLSFAEQIAKMATRRPDAARRDLPPFVVCLDGGYGREFLEAVGALPLNVIPVSIAKTRYDLSRLPLVGAYNQSNVLVAAALAEAAGVPFAKIQSLIPTLTPRWGRLERVENASVAASVFVDFAHTPDGLDKVLRAMRPLTKGKLWVVFGAGGNRDKAKRPLMGEIAARLADVVIVTSDNPRNEEPRAIIDEIVCGMSARDRENREKVFIESDRKRAIFQALAHAAADDVVILAGKGHETMQEIAQVKYPFDDREMIREFCAK